MPVFTGMTYFVGMTSFTGMTDEGMETKPERYKMKKLKCKYCKKAFQPVRKQKLTCGQKECQRKRKKDYQKEYMQRPEPREKRLLYYSEYIKRPEVKKHVQKYFQMYYQKKKKASQLVSSV